MISAGLDVGGTKILGVAVHTDDPASVVAELRTPTPDGGAGLVEALADVVARLAEVAGEVRSVGVGVPGLVDRAGVLHVGPHLRHVADLPLGSLLVEQTGGTVVVDNDANCHAVAEQAVGAARGAADALVVTLGTGIGAGVIAHGSLLHGANGFAGEAGHMVVDPNGPPCPCGKRGCWERYASGSGLARLARDAALADRLDAAIALAGGDPEAVRGEHVTDAARAGDAEALELFDQFGWWVALGLANLVNILDPEVVVIGGGLVEARDLVFPPMLSHYGELVMAGDRRPAMPIVPAALGGHAGAIGAALLAAGVGAG